jgi:hypothetical protein
MARLRFEMGLNHVDERLSGAVAAKGYFHDVSPKAEVTASMISISLWF